MEGRHELHHQYHDRFEPAKLDDKLHELEVKIKQSGAKGTYRRRSTVLRARGICRASRVPHGRVR